MICYADRIQTVREGVNLKILYRCTLEDNTWSATIAVETANLTQTETELDNFIYSTLASLVSTQASIDTNTTVTVTESDIRMVL
jgi:hypothetical protein